MKKWEIAILAIVIALFFAWYVFRPERLVFNHSVHEELPTTAGRSSAQTLASGRFHSVLHPTEGTATIYRIGDGSRVLRFTNFRTSNGPDVHVYMVAAEDAKDNASVQRAGFIDLGRSRETSVTKTTLSDPKWTCRNTERFLFGANGSVSILELRH